MNREPMDCILPGIYRIPVPLAGNPLKELNSYLICGTDRNLLVDTGFHTEDCRRAVEEGLACLGVSMEHTDILVTHLHADHAGNVPDLIRGDHRVYMSGIDPDVMKQNWKSAGEREIHMQQKQCLLKHGIAPLLVEEMLEATPSRKLAGVENFTGYTPLADGDEITVGDYTLRAILTPGHTPGQMCFEILGTGAMLLGDHVLFDITPNITEWPGVEDSLGDYLKSLDKIDRYDVTIPLPGHRKPGDFHSRIAALKEHHARRLQECREVIGKLGHAKLYDIAGNMTWRIRTDSWDTFPAAQRWFALGECLSHMDYLKKRGLIEEHVENGILWYSTCFFRQK